MKYLLAILFSSLFTLITLAEDSTAVVIHHYSEKIIVHSADEGFTRYISIYGTCNRKSYFIPASIDQVNDSLSDFKLYNKKRKKYQQVKDAQLTDMPGLSHFHDTHIIKLAELDSGTNFFCSFRIDCKKLILLSSVPLYSLYLTDTANYLLSVPKGMTLGYDWVNTNKVAYRNLSQYTSDDTLYYKLDIIPMQVTEKNNSKMLPLMRLVVFPDGNKKSADEYFNDWYLSGISKVSTLTPASKWIIDSIAVANANSKSLLSVYYEYIKKRFKYLDVMVGMGAFIPRDVNTILTNRQGDCKDLANLLCAILKYKGYDAHLAFAATNGYSCDFNFPSLSSGNHMICTVRTDSALLLLDATDINHIPGQPVQSLQGKTIFITGDPKPYYYTVPTLPHNKNKYNIQLNLSSRNKTLEGDFTMVASGYLCNTLKWMLASYSDKEINRTILQNLRDIFHNQAIDSFTYQVYTDSVSLQGKIKYFNKYYVANNLIYLFIDYIPCLYSNSFDENKITEETFVGTTMNKNFDMQVSFENSIRDVEFVPYSIKNDAYSIDFNARKVNDKTISVHYQFINTKIWILNSDIDSVNSLIDNFNKKKHETVVMHF